MSTRGDDPFERIRYAFPFCTIDIKQFDMLLSSIKCNFKAEGYFTEFVSLYQLQLCFCNNFKSWSSQWPKIEKLLKLTVFKDVIMNQPNQVFKRFIQQNGDTIINWTTKLEISILGLLWCRGTHKDKTRFLNKIINPNSNRIYSFADKELVLAFKKLFYISCDLAIQFSENENFEIPL